MTFHAKCLALLVLAAAGGCTATTTPDVPADCAPSTQLTPDVVPRCLFARRVISAAARADGDSVLADAQHVADSLTDFFAHSEVVRTMDHLAADYSRGLFADSARYDRAIDRIAVTLEYERGLQPVLPGRYTPKRTPGLTWDYYPNLGLYFQPVTSVEDIEWNFPAPWVRTDSLTIVGDALYRYAIWYRAKGGTRFPVWEYDFPWNSGGWPVDAPWHSAMAQGLALLVFTQLWDRTRAPLWKTRAYETFRSYRVSWDEGGALMPDTTHGDWWEEYAPYVQVWNGSVTALLELDYFAKVMHDSTAAGMVASGIRAVKYYTPRYYDTGTWMNYSRTQGAVSTSYMAYHVMLADTLYARTGDPWFRQFAQKISAYQAPVTAARFVPFLPSPNAVAPPPGIGP